MEKENRVKRKKLLYGAFTSGKYKSATSYVCNVSRYIKHLIHVPRLFETCRVL